MKKLVSMVLILAMAVLCFTGCMSREDRIVVNEDGSGHIDSKIVMDKAEADRSMESAGMTIEDMGLGKARVETVDGVESYVIETSVDFADYEELKRELEASGYSGVFASENGLRYVFGSDISKEDLKKLEEQGFKVGEDMKAGISITMPKEIVKTTGSLSADKRTATFAFVGNDLYRVQDVMVSTAKETDKPVLDGVKNRKTYDSARTVAVKDASGIKTARYKKDGGKYRSFTSELQKTFTKNGKYTVYATDFFGNKAVKTFTIKDKTRPAISGVANGKTYSGERRVAFRDNCGVKSVKCYIDGKKAEMPEKYLEDGAVTAAESGAYRFIVTDVNGNTKTVSFKIK